MDRSTKQKINKETQTLNDTIDGVLKSRDITLPTKIHILKTMDFPVAVCGCERWTIKKAECCRIDAFKLWCWRRCLRVPLTARKSNQSILKEINTNIHGRDRCWSWSSNTLATLCEELTHWKRPWCWERLKAGGEGGDRGWDGWMASLTQWTRVWANSGRWWRTGKPGVLQSMGSQRVSHDWATEQKSVNFLPFNFSVSSDLPSGIIVFLPERYLFIVSCGETVHLAKLS